MLSNVITNHNGDGITVDGHLSTGASLNVTIVDSEASNNGSFGFGIQAASAPSGAATAVMLRNVVASYSGTGLEAAGTNTIRRVAHSVVTGNLTGVTVVNGGTLFSYGDNDINGNTNDNFGALTPLPTH